MPQDTNAPTVLETILEEARLLFFGWIDAVLGTIEPGG